MCKNNIKITILLGAMILMMWCSYLYMQEVTITGIVQGKGFKPMVIGLENVYRMADDESTREIAEVVYDVLKSDLKFSRLFNIVESKNYMELPVYRGEDEDLFGWRRKKVDFICV